MDILTILVVAAVLLLVGAFVGRNLKSRKALAAAAHRPTLPRHAAGASPAGKPPQAAAQVDDTAAEVGRLRLKLLNCFGGNEGAMSRSVTFERKKFSHLSEAELLKKMLYDFERGH
jgi:hypothetical protein